MVIYFLSWLCLFFPNTRPDDRAIPPRTSDISRPIARPVLRASLPIAFRGRGHSGGGGAVRLSPERGDVLKRPATTSRAGAPDPSHTDRREQGGRGCGAGSGRPRSEERRVGKEWGGRRARA